jgi:hypothetical protein
MRTWPLWLAHRGVTLGRGFIANVELAGRLVAHQDSTGVWLEGVTPAGLVIDAGASTIDEVQPLVRETLVDTLNVFAKDAGTFREFRDAVHAFLSTTDETAIKEWRDAVERVRSTRERLDGLDVLSADREASVTVAEMAVEDLTPVETTPPTDYLRTAA